MQCSISVVLGARDVMRKLEWIPTKDEYNNEYKIETKDLNEEDVQKYKWERELNAASKNLQQKLEKVGETNDRQSWLAFLKSFFGLIEVDIEIPEGEHEKFGEMPPLFKNIEYSEEKSGEYMKRVIL